MSIAPPRDGFSLHANTLVPAHRRDQLERLLRYTARGAVALELLEKLAALVPLPRLHLVRYGSCLAPHSTLRVAVIPTPRQQGVEEPEGRRPSPNWPWVRLLKRVFAIDMERARCVSKARCGSSQRFWKPAS